jgi:putative FmdB family regulatory protein
MPTYDYECKKCGNVFEKELKIADRKLPTESSCEQIVLGQIQASPNCGGEVTQLITAPGFAYDNIGPNKPDASFNDKLKEIKKAHYGSTLNVIE